MKTVEWLLWLIVAGAVTVTPFRTASSEELFEDDPCTLRSGDRGVCRLAAKCAWLKEALRAHQITYSQLVTCGFNRDEPIVCCRTEQSSTRVSVRAAVQACGQYDGVQTGLAFHIIGGEEANDGDVPFIGALGYRDNTSTPATDDGDADDIKWNCGSSLIAPRYLLTAAHCIDTVYGRPVLVRMGTINLIAPQDKDAVQDRTIKQHIVHPEYKRSRNYHDIALLEVTSPFQFDDTVLPTCLQSDGADLPMATELLVAGWGLTETDKSSTGALRKANLSTVSLDACKLLYEPLKTVFLNRLRDGILPSQYCGRGTLRADLGHLHEDSCQGDSGGPLYLLAGDRVQKYYLVGVTSFGTGCGSDRPGIYTRVAHYLDWIESHVWATPDAGGT